MSIFRIILISLASVLAKNLVFTNYLGLEPFFDGTKTRKEAFADALSIIVSVTACSFVTSLFDALILRPLSIEYMKTVVFVLIIAVMWRVFGAFKTRIRVPSPYVFLSTAVLGTALIISSNSLNPIEAIVYGAAAGAGFMLSSFLFAEIKRHLEYAETPKFLKGLPMLLITAGLIALVFTGFHGMKFI